MSDNEREQEGVAPDITAPTLRIHLPTAAAAAGGGEESGKRQPTGDRWEMPGGPQSGRPTTPPAPIDDMLPPIQRIVGRSVAEQSVRGTGGIEGDEPRTDAFVLPDWADPPTGLVPRVLLDEDAAPGAEGDLVDVGLRGPSWREDGSDWDNNEDLAFLRDDEEADSPTEAVSRPMTARHNYDFEFEGIDFDFGVEEKSVDAKWDEAFGDRELQADVVNDEEPEERGGEASFGATDRDRQRRQPRRRPQVQDPPPKSKRSGLVATLVGLALGAIALFCFEFGPRTTLVLVAFAVTLAAAELFSSLQRAGYRPATLIGIVAVPLMIFGTYLHGPIAVPFVIALLMLSFAIWGISGLTPQDPILNLGVTALVVTWTGILGSFAGLLLNPNAFPHRHGVAYLVGAVALTVAHDVGSYAVGARLGRHQIAPRVSPGKTREGLIGGSALTLVVALAIVSHIHPFGLVSALLLGIVVIVFAPLGDLFESVAKRDLGLKDMGKILPAHGGIFDRIDAMLFVMPACYFLLRLLGKN